MIKITNVLIEFVAKIQFETLNDKWENINDYDKGAWLNGAANDLNTYNEIYKILGD